MLPLKTLLTFTERVVVVCDMSAHSEHAHGHIESANTLSGVSSCCSNSRTSLKTMAVVVVVMTLVALFGRLNSGSLSEQSYAGSTDSSSGILQSKNEGDIPSSLVIRPIVCTFINDVAEQIEQSKMEITMFWNVSHYPNFLSTMNIPTESWKIQKAKYVKLLLEANANFVDRAENVPESFNLTFVAGFSGSSVTAGHGMLNCAFVLVACALEQKSDRSFILYLLKFSIPDNYFHEAFPQIFEDALSPVFHAMQVPFIVRNHALGNNPCYPYDACIATHLGEDLDLLTWEQARLVLVQPSASNFF